MVPLIIFIVLFLSSLFEGFDFENHLTGVQRKEGVKSLMVLLAPVLSTRQCLIAVADESHVPDTSRCL